MTYFWFCTASKFAFFFIRSSKNEPITIRYHDVELWRVRTVCNCADTGKYLDYIGQRRRVNGPLSPEKTAWSSRS